MDRHRRPGSTTVPPCLGSRRDAQQGPVGRLGSGEPLHLGKEEHQLDSILTGRGSGGEGSKSVTRGGGLLRSGCCQRGVEAVDWTLKKTPACAQVRSQERRRRRRGRHKTKTSCVFWKRFRARAARRRCHGTVLTESRRLRLCAGSSCARQTPKSRQTRREKRKNTSERSFLREVFSVLRL